MINTGRLPAGGKTTSLDLLTLLLTGDLKFDAHMKSWKASLIRDSAQNIQSCKSSQHMPHRKFYLLNPYTACVSHAMALNAALQLPSALILGSHLVVHSPEK